ncbi:MAG TPA: anthranilate phosphoribosyltransferase [Limnochordia bacterium]|nr:anthranilate phosphoribosyltransferase [Limnochordia bacterium]
MRNVQHAIAMAVLGKSIDRAQAAAAMGEVMGGEATPAQIAAWITALRMKGESVDEITGCAEAMRAKAAAIRPQAETVVDTCGTGGDGANTFNISTTAAFVVAGCGLSVAKHGNRSVSSRCGSADVLEHLGIRLDLTPAQVERAVDEIGIGFLFAPAFHAAMKHAIGPRREIGVRTIFNLLGPLTNPAGATAQVVGVYSAELTEPLAQVLGNLGIRRALVVHGLDRLDEVSITGPTQISQFDGGTVRTYRFVPGDAGVNSATARAVAGGDAAENARILRSVLAGETGARRDVVLLNAAAALIAGGAASGFAEGVALAAESIDSGAALAKLDALRRYSSACVAAS